MAFSHATDTYKYAVTFVILIIGVLYAFHSCVKMQYQTTWNEKISADDYPHQNEWKQTQLNACFLLRVMIIRMIIRMMNTVNFLSTKKCI